MKGEEDIQQDSPSGYASVADDYWASGFHPIPVRGKTPPPGGATGRNGVVDHEKIKDWSERGFRWFDPETDQWQTQDPHTANTALRADGWMGIDVDAYGDKVGDQTIATLEETLGDLPTTISSTSRGPDQPSRIHCFRVPRDRRFITALKDVEIIQFSHRYAIVHPSIHPDGEGRVYQWYGYEDEPLDRLPSLDDLEELPEAWLEFLTAPPAEESAQTYGGSVAEWLKSVPQGTPGLLMQQRMNEIPKHRDFNHDEMISTQAAFVALAAQGETGVEQALAELKKEWLREPYNTAEYRADWDTALAGAVSSFGALPDGPGDIREDLGDALNRVTVPGFLDLYIGTPVSGSAAAMRERIALIASKALASGLPFMDAASLAYSCAAARASLRAELSDEQAREQVWAIVQEAVTSPTTEEKIHTADAVPEPVEVLPAEAVRTVDLLTTHERAQLQGIQSTKWGPDARWFGDHFMNVMHLTHSVLSEPYYRASVWLILSLIFADRAVIEFDSGTRVIFNFYINILGPSNSGKSESLNPVKGVAKAFYEAMGDNPDIGGDATAAALTAALIRRNGQTSLFHSDEADATLLNWANQTGEFRGMKQRITDVYKGEVPAIQRQTQQDLSGIHATAFLNVHLTGIDDKITDAINPDDWRTGFINRFVWVEGERKYRTREMRRNRLRKPGALGEGSGASAFYYEWANRFRGMKTKLEAEGGMGPVFMSIDEDVLDREVDVKERLEAIALHSGVYQDRVDPTFRRLGDEYALKCAALVALSEGRTNIEMPDYLIALEQVEEWGEKALEMVRRTDLSPRARQVNRMADTIRSRGGRMEKSAIYREETYAGDYKYAEGIIRELEAQKRAELLALPGQEPLVRLLEPAA